MEHLNKRFDFRSDTVTVPTQEMREDFGHRFRTQTVRFVTHKNVGELDAAKLVDMLKRVMAG